MTGNLTAINLAHTARRTVAVQIARAAEDTGFLILEDHGLPQELLDQAFAASHQFYALPQPEKNRFHPITAGIQRGYHAAGTRNLAATLNAASPPDLRESLFLGPFTDHRAHFADRPEATGIYAPNILPDSPPEFAEILRTLYAAFDRTAMELLRYVALALDIDEGYFNDKFDRHFNIMGCHYYPPLAVPGKPGQQRAGAHTDFGAITLLAVNDAPGGLEIQRSNGQWLPVRPRPGQLIVNLGDMMARWTNDKWVSTVHRVVTPPAGSGGSAPRQSIAYFLHPSYDAEISCIPSCHAEDGTAGYPPILAGHHIAEKIAKSHHNPIVQR